jgi:hypothetical protein
MKGRVTAIAIVTVAVLSIPAAAGAASAHDRTDQHGVSERPVEG